MKIDGNEIEKAAMKEFHKGNRAQGLRIQEEFASKFRKEYADKDHCPCTKHADITATVKNVLRSTGRMGNMCPVVCGL